jgi:hypothetical protein
VGHHAHDDEKAGRLITRRDFIHEARENRTTLVQIRRSYVSPIGVNPGADGILTALEALSPPNKEETDAQSTR